MRTLLKKITHPFLKYALKLWYLKPRNYRYHNIVVLVHPEVFPPHLTLSTKIFLDFIKPFELRNKNFLELGCGSGILSILAAKKGAAVTATDINEKALEFLEKNAKDNSVNLNILKSDLFTNLTDTSFDYILINPPYYPKHPKNMKEQAWFCGENFEYFQNLFIELPNFTNSNNTVLMILSQDCNIKHIQSIANKNGLEIYCIFEKTVALERNFIYQIKVFP